MPLSRRIERVVEALDLQLDDFSLAAPAWRALD
jgi:hypothetical protein